ncbi:MAG: hypothetical protein HQ500_10535 [Flavobacteriales bacterium]|nr:hypothetical protein [Flavobacteriales bacterium]
MFGTVNSSGKLRHVLFTCAILSMVFIHGCKTDTSSGDCYYDKADTMAEVMDIRPNEDDPTHLEVILDFKASKLAFEDQEMGQLKGVEIDQDFVDRNRIKVGNQYSVIVSEITKGDCIPRIVSFQHALD